MNRFSGDLDEVIVVHPEDHVEPLDDTTADTNDDTKANA